MYELVPLQFFEMVHFSAYSSSTYKDHFRQLRLANKNTTTASPVVLTTGATALLPDMKESNKKYNDAKWTRQALSAVSMPVTLAAEKSKEPTAKKVVKEKYVNPF